MVKKVTAREELESKSSALVNFVTEAQHQVDRYLHEDIKSAGTKARNALRDLKACAQEMRVLVLEIRNESKAK